LWIGFDSLSPKESAVCPEISDNNRLYFANYNAHILSGSIEIR
jgi:hypothetical protein